MAAGLYGRFNRRSALTGAGRWVLAAFAVAVGAFGVVKRGCLRARGVCVNQSLCAGCEALNECSLPAAGRFRETTRSQSTHD